MDSESQGLQTSFECFFLDKKEIEACALKNATTPVRFWTNISNDVW